MRWKGLNFRLLQPYTTSTPLYLSMKKTLLCAFLAAAGLSSCRTKCPAYSSVKPATQVATPAMASTPSEAAPRQ